MTVIIGIFLLTINIIAMLIAVGVICNHIKKSYMKLEQERSRTSDLLYSATDIYEKMNCDLQKRENEMNDIINHKLSEIIQDASGGVMATYMKSVAKAQTRAVDSDTLPIVLIGVASITLQQVIYRATSDPFFPTSALEALGFVGVTKHQDDKNGECHYCPEWMAVRDCSGGSVYNVIYWIYDFNKQTFVQVEASTGFKSNTPKSEDTLENIRANYSKILADFTVVDTLEEFETLLHVKFTKESDAVKEEETVEDAAKRNSLLDWNGSTEMSAPHDAIIHNPKATVIGITANVLRDVIGFLDTDPNFPVERLEDVAMVCVELAGNQGTGVISYQRDHIYPFFTGYEYNHDKPIYSMDFLIVNPTARRLERHDMIGQNTTDPKAFPENFLRYHTIILTLNDFEHFINYTFSRDAYHQYP